jgi:hypothetical protein
MISQGTEPFGEDIRPVFCQVVLYGVLLCHDLLLAYKRVLSMGSARTCPVRPCLFSGRLLYSFHIVLRQPKRACHEKQRGQECRNPSGG